MTDKEIIRALRICSHRTDVQACTECPLFDSEDCMGDMMAGAADLIERLTAENVALREGASLGKVKRPQKIAYEKSIEFLRALTDGQSDEIKSLRRELEGKDMVIALAQRKQTEAEAERDALREKVPQWVSVEERLPIDCLKKYLVAFRDAGGPIVDMARYFPSDGWTCDNWDVPQKLVTHWMPLPEAAEEGEKA